MAPPDAITSLLRPALADPRAAAIVLDLDGTVAPIVDQPDRVRIAERARDALPVLRDRFGLVAFVSGRALAELERIVGVPGLALSGNHGAEIRLADGRAIGAGTPDTGALAAFGAAWRDAAAGHGAWLEDKGATLTFHYRTAPDPGAARSFLEGRVMPAARAAGLTAAPGRMSLEVRPSGDVTKATAVRALLAAVPGLRQAVAIGDDRTDVDAWAAMREAVTAGRLAGAVALGVRSDETPDAVTAAADALLDGVDAAAAVLAHLAAHAA